MRKLSALLMVCFWWATNLSFAQKLTVSVMDLNVTEGLSAKEVVMLTDKLLNEFVGQGVYKVIERSKRDEILKEQGFQQSGACDASSCLVEAGQYLGAQKMFGGTIGKFGAVFAVELRMIDVKTGEIDMAFSKKYTGDVSNLLDAMKEAAAEFSRWKPKPTAQPIAETKAEYGSIRVQSTPAGARIFLDGAEVGATPGLIPKVEAGEHNIVIVKEGYSSFSRTVSVAKNITATVNAVLTKEYGTLNITSEPANAAVYIDGVNKGLTGSIGLKVTGLGIGVHKVRVSKAGYVPYEVEMTVESGEGNALQAVLEPKPGSIVITSTPSGASVSVDGRPQGNTPCSVTNLSPGTYNVKVEKTGYEDGQVSVSVGPGESVARAIVLKKTPTTPSYPSPRGEGRVGLTSLGGGEFRNEKDGSILIEIPAGEFTMGSNDGDEDEKPVHKVYLDKYYIGKYEVTVGQFRKFVNATGYKTDAEKSGGAYVYVNGSWTQKADANWSNPYFNQTDNSPVVCVSWNDAKAYCDWAGLRLPTEAEWEKAARGTDGRKYPWGNSWDASKCNSGDKADGYEYTSPVGSFPSGVSPYGCYDMAGNVWEWCNDWYVENYYGSSPSSNPTGPSSGAFRVLRGGCWYSYDYLCRASSRVGDDPGFRFNFVGFRVAQ